MLFFSVEFGSPYVLASGYRSHRLDCHDVAQLEVVEDGELWISDETSERALQPGHFVWIAPNVPHGWRAEQRVKAMTFKFRVEGDPPDDWSILVAPIAEPWRQGLPEQVARLLRQESGEARLAASHLLTAAFYQTRSDSHARHEPLAEDWLELLEELRLANGPPLALEEMARRVNCSPSHFRRLFEARFGSSPGRFQFTERMRRAHGLLRHTSFQVQEIARQVGYADVAGFSKAFGRFYGQRPSMVRHAMRQANNHDMLVDN